MMPSDYQSNAEIWFNFNLSQDTVSLQIAIGPRHLPVIGETVFQRFFICPFRVCFGTKTVSMGQ